MIVVRLLPGNYQSHFTDKGLKGTNATGNNTLIGGLEITPKKGWFAVHPFCTENIYKIYAGSFLGIKHLQKIIEEAQSIAVMH